MTFNTNDLQLPLTLVFSIWAAFLHLKQNINSCESTSQKTINLYNEKIFSSPSSCDSLSSSDVSRSSTLNDSSTGSSILEDKNESSRKSGSQCFLSASHGSLHEFYHQFVCWHSQISTLMSLLPFLRSDLVSPKPINFFWMLAWLASLFHKSIQIHTHHLMKPWVSLVCACQIFLNMNPQQSKSDPLQYSEKLK